MPLAYEQYHQEDVEVDWYERWLLTGGKAERHRRRAAKKRKLRKLLILSVVAILAGALLMGYVTGLVKIVQLKANIVGVEKDIAAISAEIEELEQRREEVQSLEYVEEVAREKLGLVKPGEVKYVVTPPSDQQWLEADVKVREDRYTEPLY